MIHTKSALILLLLCFVGAMCCPPAVFCQSPEDEADGDVDEEIILFDPAQVSPDLLEPVSPEELEELKAEWNKESHLYHQPPLDPAQATTGKSVLRNSLLERSRGKPVTQLLAVFHWGDDEEGRAVEPDKPVPTTGRQTGKVTVAAGRLRVELGTLLYIRTGRKAYFYDRQHKHGSTVSGPRSRAAASRIEEYFRFIVHLVDEQTGFDDIYSDFVSSRYVIKSLPPDESPVYGVFKVRHPAKRLESLEVLRRDTKERVVLLRFLSWNVNPSLPKGLFRVPRKYLDWDDIPVTVLPVFLR